MINGQPLTKRREPVKVCAFCGSTNGITKDHIPPKTIFPEPRPSNLITVPACKKCNLSISKDEEYFRLKLCLNQKTGDHPDARKNRDNIFRSLYRREAKGLRNSFINDIHNVRLTTPNGVYLEKGYVFDVELTRIFNVIRKIVKGLYYYERGFRLDDSCEINVHSDDTLTDNPPEVLEDLKQKISIPLFSKTPKVIGEQTFLYRFHVSDENPCFSVWLLTFYGHLNFLSLTGPSREEQD